MLEGLHFGHWGHVEVIGATWKSLGPRGSHWGHVEVIGATWKSLGPRGSHWGHGKCHWGSKVFLNLSHPLK